jgi:hypothetical protein
MLAVLHLLGMFVIDLFKSRRRLEAENMFLRHQLTVAIRRAPRRLRLRGCDRALLVWMTLAEPAQSGTGGSAGDHSSLAPRGLQDVLALEVAKEGRAAKDRSRTARTHSAANRQPLGLR